jgi:hypothetical protein
MELITFVELPPFTRNIYRYMSEEQYQVLQDYLNAYPTAGDVIPGTRGCRKIRWATEGYGKRGGLRIIYFYRAAGGKIYMLTIYAKNEEENIPSHFVRKLREGIKDE